MSIEAMSQVWKRSKEKGSALLLLLAIADNYNEDKGCAWPSVEYLSKKCRMTPRNVNLLLTRLQEHGAITVEAGAGPKGTNIYRLASIGAEKISDEKPRVEGVKNPAHKISGEPLKGTVNEPLEKKPAGAGAETAGAEQEFFDQWAQSFEMQFGRKYLFVNAAKDRTKLRKLLSVTKAQPGELMTTVTKAWARGVTDRSAFNCRNAITISAFCDRFEEITNELAMRSPNDRPLPGARPQAGKAPPLGLKPASQRPPPRRGQDLKEWARQYPASDYFDESTLEPLKDA